MPVARIIFYHIHIWYFYLIVARMKRTHFPGFLRVHKNLGSFLHAIISNTWEVPRPIPWSLSPVTFEWKYWDFFLRFFHGFWTIQVLFVVNPPLNMFWMFFLNGSDLEFSSVVINWWFTFTTNTVRKKTNITFPARKDEQHVFWSGDFLTCYLVISLTFILNIRLMEEILHQLRDINLSLYIYTLYNYIYIY